MFANFFMALKRIVDGSLVPVLFSLLAIAFEIGIGAITWVLIKIADFLLSQFGNLLSLIPFPDIDVNAGFTGLALDLAEITGVWPAALVFLTISVIAFITRIFTLGVVGGQ